MVVTPEAQSVEQAARDQHQAVPVALVELEGLVPQEGRSRLRRKVLRLTAPTSTCSQQVETAEMVSTAAPAARRPLPVAGEPVVQAAAAGSEVWEER
jgi:hypothetical protein